MKHTLLFSLVLFAAATTRAFEGNVTYDVTQMNGRSATLTCQVKGDRVVVTSELLRGQGSMLIIPKEQAAYTLIPALRLAMKQPIDAAETARSLGKVELKATKKTETVAGTRCTVYTVRTDDATGEACAAPGLDNLYAALTPAASLPAWTQEVRKKGLFPLKATVKDTEGRTFRLVATRVEKTQLPAAQFSVPEEFRVTEGMDLGGLLGGSGQP